VADDQPYPKIIKMLLSYKILKVLFDKLPGVYSIPYSYGFKDHLVCCQSACFISKNAINNSELLNDGSIQNSTIFIDLLIVHLTIKGKKDA
jgi:hypothetical protein